VKIAEYHTLGYNGYCDGHWATPEQATTEMALPPQSTEAQAIRRGMELARIDMDILNAQAAFRISKSKSNESEARI